jgi:hypothetical protein
MENLIPQKVGFDAFDFTNCGVKITPIFIFGDFGFQPGKVLYRLLLWQRVVPMRKLTRCFADAIGLGHSCLPPVGHPDAKM